VDAPTAFRQQLLGVIPSLRRYARSLVFDHHAADDLVQTALERALAHWHQFDQRRDILVWTISIAHNAYIDERRRHVRAALIEPSEGFDPDASQPAPGRDIGLQLDLIKALARLSLEQREVLLLVTLEQLSYAECAEALRIPIGTVMSRVARARIALRAFLSGGGDGKDAMPAQGTLRRVV
jgi:RNA polymerase sigma-70 factor (ECF subfamily)